jgi:hypothetical protein
MTSAENAIDERDCRLPNHCSKWGKQGFTELSNLKLSEMYGGGDRFNPIVDDRWHSKKIDLSTIGLGKILCCFRFS